VGGLGQRGMGATVWENSGGVNGGMAIYLIMGILRELERGILEWKGEGGMGVWVFFSSREFLGWKREGGVGVSTRSRLQGAR